MSWLIKQFTRFSDLKRPNCLSSLVSLEVPIWNQQLAHLLVSQTNRWPRMKRPPMRFTYQRAIHEDGSTTRPQSSLEQWGVLMNRPLCSLNGILLHPPNGRPIHLAAPNCTQSTAHAHRHPWPATHRPMPTGFSQKKKFSQFRNFLLLFPNFWTHTSNLEFPSKLSPSTQIDCF